MPASMPPDVHYLWIGPPNIAEGQDTIGPDLLQRRYKDQPIHFWCLKKHEHEYRQYFNSSDRAGLPIQVHNIEDFIESKIDEYPNLTDFIERLKASAETQEDISNAIRERVTIKAMTQYFLQIYFDGYFLDSNIIPDPDINLPELPTLDHFTVPIIFSMQNMGETIDPWLMYTPKGDKIGQRQRFEQYLHEALDEFFSRDKVHPEINRKRLSDAFTKSAANHPETKTTNASTKRAEAPCLFGFQKRYQNTHKPSSRGIHRFPKVHLILIQYPALEEFQYLFEHSHLSADEIYVLPNLKGGTPKATSLIHTAIEKGLSDILTYLLTQVTDIKTLYTNDEKNGLRSALEESLAHNFLDDHYECLGVLLIHSFQQLHYDKENFFNIINALSKELASIYGMPSNPAILIQSIENLQDALHTDEARRTAYQKAVMLSLKIGPLNEENKAQYIQALRREHLKHHRHLRAQNRTLFSPLLDTVYTLFGQGATPLPEYDSNNIERVLGTIIPRTGEAVVEFDELTGSPSDPAEPKAERHDDPERKRDITRK